MRNLKTYLAGHIPKRDEVDWRNVIIQYFQDTNSRHFQMYNERAIDFLIPEDSKEQSLHNYRHDLTATRDLWYLNICDIAIVNLNLNIGQCLGAMWEFGYLRAHNKPVILVNHHSDLPKTKFLEHNSSVVVTTLEEACKVLDYMISG